MLADQHVVLFQTTPDQLPPNEPLTYDQPVSGLPVVDDARWSADLTSHSVGALVVWIILLIVLQSAAWPLVRRVFHRFPDKGWAFARVTSLLASGYVVWLLASIEVISFRAIWSGVALLGFGAIVWFSGRSPKKHVTPWFKSRPIVSSELVFWITFAIFLIFRLINPDSYHPTWGGEKPMEFAHLNALLRSPHFPPVDPWYAGGFINYYYYGTYLVAFMLKLTGVPSEIGFNLAQPTFIALIAVGAFSVSCAIVRRLVRTESMAITGGLIGVVLVSFSGNLISAARVWERSRDSSPVNAFDYWVWGPSRAIPGTITEFPFFTGLYADLHAHLVAFPMTILVIALGYAVVLEGRSVTLALLRPRRNPDAVRWTVCAMGLLALTIGSLFPTNAWDAPTYAALAAVSALTATRYVTSVPARLAISAGLVALTGLLSYVLVLPFYQHYVALYSSVRRISDPSPLVAFESHLGVFILIILLSLGSLMVARISRPSFLFDPLLATAAIGMLLIIRWYSVGRDPQLGNIADVLLVVAVVGLLLAIAIRVPRGKIDFGLPETTQFITLPIVLVATVVALLMDRQTMALALGIGGLAIWLWLRNPNPTIRFIALMIAGGTLVAAGLEVFFLVDNLVTNPDAYRMNSVFKFYNGVWTLLAISSSALMTMMIARILDRADGSPETKRPTVISDIGWARIGTVIGTIAIIASLAYPLTATGPRLDQRFVDEDRVWSLDALSWMDSSVIAESSQVSIEMAFAEDHQIINWFNDTVGGTPVIAEASTGIYRCNGSRISIATGLPTVIGWQNHESQQRYATYLDERAEDVLALYTSEDPSEKLQIIAKYDIQYIVVGQIERNYPKGGPCNFRNNAKGIAAFDPLVGRELEVAFSAGHSLVYRVID